MSGVSGARGGGADEIDDVLHLCALLEQPGGVLHAFCESALLCKQQTVGRAQIMDRIALEAAAFQSDEIKPCKPAVIVGHAVGDQVAGHRRAAADKGVISDTALLMQRRKPAHGDAIADNAAAAERSVVCEHHVVADHAIVGDMTCDHEIAVRAHARDSSAGFGAQMHGDVLAQHVLVTNLQADVATLVLEVLGRLAQRHERMEQAVRTEPGASRDGDMRQEACARADLHMGADDAIGPDLGALADHRRRIDDGGGMNSGHQISRTADVAENSASAHFTPSTRASPLNLNTPRRLATTSTGISSRSPGRTVLRNFAFSTPRK